MLPDSTLVTSNLSTFTDWVKLIGAIIPILGGVASITVLFFTRFLPWYRAKRNSRSLKKRFGADLYPAGAIEGATRYYIEPFCQSVDPAGGEEPRLVYGTKENIFAAVDNALNDPTEYRYLILLADSGMGKTSFLLNYYARYLRRYRKEFELVLMPLGIPDADERLATIPDKKDKVLFLDALDEDTLAIVDHTERLGDLMKLTRDFQKILITCRTQFFPKDEEIPRETGIVKVGPIAAGERAEYVFHKLYISPFTNEQVDKYLKRRYPALHYKQRRKARKMVQKIPHLSVRPMLLAHIKDLVRSNRQIKYSFELYEEMVEAWLIREEGRLEGIKKEPLRQFSELLAIDLYVNRKQRGAERIRREEISELAKAHHISLDEWQLTGRSLLNRDAAGNYKFAHRSIMEYLFVKRFLKMEPDARPRISWTDQMNRFLLEMLYYHFDQNRKNPDLSNIDLKGLIDLKPKALVNYRSDSRKLSSSNVTRMMREFDFYDSNDNKTGKGIQHLYVEYNVEKEDIIFDLVTGLVWQQSGSTKSLKYEDAEKWIKKLNQKGYAGFHDWRLPTLEEAMSLLEPTRSKAGLYINPIFDDKQRWIWTADLVKGQPWARVVHFHGGDCGIRHFSDDRYVRAVRSGQSSEK